ncbi:MAG: ATP-binding cassette domain-containing protein, partial [Rhizobium sp.]|uniref:ATP-binding cassette domain-containing protein n=1 Tax=Rhizobium sp. TaxID=391 RepID=UPI00389A6B4B
MTAVNFNNVSIIFGDRPETALAMVDQGKSRDEIGAATGLVLGVADASLTIEEGEILVLMGLSGSGKSTLLRAVNGLAPVVRGDVAVSTTTGPVNPYRCNAKALRDLRTHTVSMVFQQFALLPWRTVAENVGFGLELAGMPEAERKLRVGEQLELVNLTKWAGRKVNELSGGMQQRVGLARAFATGAPILLMDEPVSALDPWIRTRLQDELLEFQ